MKRSIELSDLTVGQARLVALAAKAARTQRDMLLGNVSEENMGEPRPAHGELDPADTLGFEPLPPESVEIAALRGAVCDLSDAARAELYTLMRTGQGSPRREGVVCGLAQAKTLDSDVITAAIVEDVDLHDDIAKGLYETGLSSS